jgi:hypothetical protein
MPMYKAMVPNFQVRPAMATLKAISASPYVRLRRGARFMSFQPRRSQRNGAAMSSVRHGATKGMFSGDGGVSETGIVDMQLPPLGNDLLARIGWPKLIFYRRFIGRKPENGKRN